VQHEYHRPRRARIGVRRHVDQVATAPTVVLQQHGEVAGREVAVGRARRLRARSDEREEHRASRETTRP
jgi:hypothetical protein